MKRKRVFSDARDASPWELFVYAVRIERITVCGIFFLSINIT